MLDVVCRMEIMRSSLRQYRSNVLKNRSLDISIRMQLAQALMLSKGLYNAGVWPQLNAQEARRCHTSVKGVFRAVADHEKWKNCLGPIVISAL